MAFRTKSGLRPTIASSTHLACVPGAQGQLVYSSLKKYQKAWDSHQNAIFIPKEKLSFNNNYSGSGVFDFSSAVTLTKPGYSRTRWEFPNNMRGIKISHNPNGWKKDYFQSSPIGQEFVFNCNNAVIDWLNSMFRV